MNFSCLVVSHKISKRTDYNRCLKSLGLLFFLIVLSSCGVTHREFPLSYPSMNPPSSPRDPITITLEVLDNRVIPENEMIGKYGKVIFVVQNGAVPTIKTALKNALEVEGYQVIDAKDQEAQVHIKLNLSRLWVEDTNYFAAYRTVAEVKANVEVSSGIQKFKTINFDVDAYSSHVLVIAGRWGIYYTMQPAFEDFIKQVATHPDFVSFIKDIKPS